MLSRGRLHIVTGSFEHDWKLWGVSQHIRILSPRIDIFTWVNASGLVPNRPAPVVDQVVEPREVL